METFLNLSPPFKCHIIVRIVIFVICHDVLITLFKAVNFESTINTHSCLYNFFHTFNSTDMQKYNNKKITSFSFRLFVIIDFKLSFLVIFKLLLLAIHTFLSCSVLWSFRVFKNSKAKEFKIFSIHLWTQNILISPLDIGF